MSNFVLAAALAVPLWLAGAASPAHAQNSVANPVGAVELQANPVGAGANAAVPPVPATADSPVPAAMPADPTYHGGPYTGALTPPPVSVMHKTYPPCTGRLRDNCINPGQAMRKTRTSSPTH